MRVSIIGAGSWGTAIYRLLKLKGLDVSIWARREEIVRRLERGESPYLEGVKIPPGYVSTDIDEVLKDSDLAVFAVPAQFVRKVLKTISNPPKRVVNLAKGIELETKKRMEEVFKEEIEPEFYATLSGPSHAEEVARDIPTAVVVASSDGRFAREVQEIFSTDRFRVYTNSDVIGVEIAGSMKNVIAIAAGILDGFGGWDNSKAALMTRGIAEIARFGVKLGGKLETFMGLAGIGDLIVTCSSRHSRNRYVGEMLGKGYKLDEILKDMKMIAEGVYTVKAIVEMARDMNVDVPISYHVHEILYSDVDPRDAMESLMRRALKPEWYQ